MEEEELTAVGIDSRRIPIILQLETLEKKKGKKYIFF